MSFAFLWEMSWKSAAIIAAALALAALLRSRSPADRAAVLRLGVGLVLMLPVIALFLPALQIETAAEPVAALPMEAYVGAESAAMEIAALQPVPTTIWDDPSSLIAILYLGGLLMVGLRIGAGLLTLRRWTRAASPVTDPAWVRAMERAQAGERGGAGIRLLVSDEADAPLSWGWLRPAILIDRDTLDRPEDADAILAHEVAHVVRRDWPALMMTRVSVALFWFNPLVWLLEREVVQQAEEAADLAALAQVEPAQYAQTLVSCARHSRTAMVPANSMAPRANGLRRRVLAILEGRGMRKSGSFWTVAAMLGCAGFAAPLAAIELVPAVAELVELSEAPQAPEAPVAPAPAAAPRPPVVLAALAAQPAPPAPLARATPTPPAPPAAASEQVVEVPAIDVDVPETRVHVPAINVDVDGVRVNVPAMNVFAPRVRVNVPPIKVRMPQLASVSLPASIALSAAHPHRWSAEDRAEYEREMKEARREAHREAAHARAEARAEADAMSRERIVEVRREARQAHHRGMAKGADGMERGADSMVRGARTMEQEADKLRNPAYRERQIARARAEGRTVTHDELIDAIPKLRAGAKKMVAGAEKMRASAARMRRGGD
ncbi:MAG TPA: M56 family metallopeptidase [Allosphingosinicella sp.]|jgi:beta-lactamase regulating signal transducer with metallopeptidase domain|uniref:M56 family metallopeptidase n=1 Tax=Allosphingosinicella sp. TaxID=2823234 RepID=UPI002F2A747B